MARVSSISNDTIKFDDGSELSHYHDQNCCESHYLSFSDLTVEDFEGLDFVLEGELFFERVPYYGIRLTPVNGHAVNIPGYGYNNGYYSSDLSLILKKGDESHKYDISECQEVGE